jgi:hypothetical protein
MKHLRFSLLHILILTLAIFVSAAKVLDTGLNRLHLKASQSHLKSMCRKGNAQERLEGISRVIAMPSNFGGALGVTSASIC